MFQHSPSITYSTLPSTATTLTTTTSCTSVSTVPRTNFETSNNQHGSLSFDKLLCGKSDTNMIVADNHSQPFSVTSMANISGLSLEYASSSQYNVSNSQFYQPPFTSSKSLSMSSSLSPSCTQSSQSLLILDPTTTSTLLSKDIFNSCKIGDLNRLKKLINSNNVNVRDTSGGQSTVSLLNN